MATLPKVEDKKEKEKDMIKEITTYSKDDVEDSIDVFYGSTFHKLDA